MKNITNFKIDTVKSYMVLFTLTSPVDYEMERIIVTEDWNSSPEPYMVIFGGHCSCYDFDETQWDAILYTQDELIKVARGWLKSGTELEKEMARLVLAYFRQPLFTDRGN